MAPLAARRRALGAWLRVAHSPRIAPAQPVARTSGLGHAGRLAPLALLCTSLALADAAPLAQVGAIAIDAASFRQRAARVAQLEWPALGATWPEQRRRLLDDVLIPEALLSLAAERAPVALPPARERALADALTAAIALEATQAAPSEAQLLADVARLQSELATPRTLSLWRILLGNEADARAVIGELTTPTVAAFSRIARERSVDHATYMRAGNLGQVSADGQTRVPELRVAPALFEAADRVADGELVREPVREGEGYAVVWRRASQPGHSPSPAEVAPQSRARLAEERAVGARSTLLEALRRERLVEYHPERLAAYEPSYPEPAAPLPRPARLESNALPPRLLPELTDRGLR